MKKPTHTLAQGPSPQPCVQCAWQLSVLTMAAQGWNRSGTETHNTYITLGKGWHGQGCWHFVRPNQKPNRKIVLSVNPLTLFFVSNLMISLKKMEKRKIALEKFVQIQLNVCFYSFICLLLILVVNAVSTLTF